MKRPHEEENDEIEIDLGELFFEFRKRWWVILLHF